MSSPPRVDTEAAATTTADDASFVLHVAFASEAAQQQTSSSSSGGGGPGLQRARTYAPNKSAAAASSHASIGMVGVGELAAPIALKYSPKTPAAPAPAPAPVSFSPPTLSPSLLAAAPASPVIAAATSPPHQPPIGFLSFPTPSLPSVPASRVTLAQVRSILPTYFTSAHITSLLSAGVLSMSSARALQTGHYYFMCASAASGGVFSPVSPMQEEQIFASSCRPVLVLKAQRVQATPHSHSTSSATPASGSAATSIASSSDSFLAKDFVQSAPNAGGRRPSFDFTHSVLSHQDTMTLLDSGVSRTAPHFGSPAPAPNQTRMLRGASHGPPVLSPAEEEKLYGYGESNETVTTQQQHDPAILMASPKLRGTNPSSEQIYRSRAEGWPVHFDDVIREKNAGHPLLSPAPHARPAQLRITVTGELLDKPRRSDSRKDIFRARRNTNIGDAAQDDEREGSIKLFTGVDEFLNDEERRRKKYDAAAAAYAAAAAAQGEDEISTDVSPSHGEPRGSPPPPPSTRSATLAQTPLWISLEDGDDRSVDLIGRYFGLHPLTIEDCQSKGIREKLEVFPEYLFLVFHALEDANTPAAGRSASVFNLHSASHFADPGAEIMRTTPLKLVVFPSLVLSFHKGGLPSVSVVRNQLDKLYSNRVLNTAWLIHGLLDVVSDSLMPVVDTAAKEADAMEDLIYVS